MSLNKDYIEVFDVYTNDYKLVEKPKENNNYNKSVRSRNNYSLFFRKPFSNRFCNKTNGKAENALSISNNYENNNNKEENNKVYYKKEQEKQLNNLIDPNSISDTQPPVQEIQQPNNLVENNFQEQPQPQLIQPPQQTPQQPKQNSPQQPPQQTPQQPKQNSPQQPPQQPPQQQPPQQPLPQPIPPKPPLTPPRPQQPSVSKRVVDLVVEIYYELGILRSLYNQLAGFAPRENDVTLLNSYANEVLVLQGAMNEIHKTLTGKILPPTSNLYLTPVLTGDYCTDLNTTYKFIVNLNSKVLRLIRIIDISSINRQLAIISATLNNQINVLNSLNNACF